MNIGGKNKQYYVIALVYLIWMEGYLVLQSWDGITISEWVTEVILDRFTLLLMFGISFLVCNHFVVELYDGNATRMLRKQNRMKVFATIIARMTASVIGLILLAFGTALLVFVASNIGPWVPDKESVKQMIYCLFSLLIRIYFFGIILGLLELLCRQYLRNEKLPLILLLILLMVNVGISGSSNFQSYPVSKVLWINALWQDVFVPKVCGFWIIQVILLITWIYCKSMISLPRLPFRTRVWHYRDWLITIVLALGISFLYCGLAKEVAADNLFEMLFGFEHFDLWLFLYLGIQLPILGLAFYYFQKRKCYAIQYLLRGQRFRTWVCRQYMRIAGQCFCYFALIGMCFLLWMKRLPQRFEVQLLCNLALMDFGLILLSILLSWRSQRDDGYPFFVIILGHLILARWNQAWVPFIGGIYVTHRDTQWFQVGYQLLIACVLMGWIIFSGRDRIEKL
ncbi:MAG: hypothetical protein K6G13_06430 [Agathobacter sp.]|uniref:hypothetical protein n=1 Tax=Agathobacter sp. TaxID=2021311 RepID=UPI00258FA84D|nr:hypothetical protein [Agathobacter sp.]MCR5677654.1 hypothetical protein [Agathobacter sp.]